MATKTSIRNIDPDTLWEAKIYAARTRQTMGEVITEAIDLLINEDEEGDDIWDDDRQHHGSQESPPLVETGLDSV